MTHTFDVLCVGSVKIDTFLTLNEANKHLRLLKETDELCIKFGEKIVVDKAKVLLGGNAANVSVGISRLGLNVSILAEIGKDEFAQKIINTLKNENVDISNILQDEGKQSSFSTIINYKGERTIFSEHVKRQHNFNFEDISAKWVYLTSLGNEWQNAYERTLAFVKGSNCLLAFNPGTLQLENGRDNLKDILSSANLLLVNKDEAEEILKYSHGENSIEKILMDLQKLGPKIVVITNGKNGSFSIDVNKNILKKDAIEVEAIEKTGAGDAYSSAFLAALVHKQTLAEAMDWGTKNSAAVIKRVGAQPGLLHKTDFENT